MAERIKIVRLIEDRVGTPRNDGTPGSALYSVPFELSGNPPSGWAEAFVAAWNHPASFTTSHRPGIASVRGKQVVLERTTMQEVERTHKETLLGAVEAANDYVEALERERMSKAEQERSQKEAHKRQVSEAAARIKFD